MSPEMMLARSLSTVQPVKEVEKTASVEDVSEEVAMEKLSRAENWGRELAREHMEKVAIPALPQVGAALKGGLGSAMHATMGASKGMRAGVGAAGGAVLGGAAGAMKNPGTDPATGQQRSRLGNVMSGAAGGAALGGAAGLGARKAIGTVAASKGAVGDAARGAMKSGVRAGAEGAKDARRVRAMGAMAGGDRAGLGAAAKANVTKNTPGVAPKPPAPAVGTVPGATAPVAAAPKPAPMTGASSRQTIDSQPWHQRLGQKLGLTSTPDNVAQAKAYQQNLGIKQNSAGNVGFAKAASVRRLEAALERMASS